MDLTLLKTFEAVAKTRNISRAAELVNLSQPAVSLQIKQLEALLGTAVFLRHPLRLTDAGEHLLESAGKILAQWQSTLDYVQAEQTLVSGSLTIACSDTVMRYALLDKITLFNKDYPFVKLSVLNRTSEQAQQAVLNGDADLAIALFTGEHAKLVYRSMLSYSDVVAVHPSHPLAEQKQITAHKLIQHNLLLLEEKTQSHKLVMNWFSGKQLTPAHAMQLGSVDAQISLARIQLGVAIVPEFSVPNDLVPVAIKGMPKRQLATFYRHLKPAAQAWFRVPDFIASKTYEGS